MHGATNVCLSIFSLTEHVQYMFVTLWKKAAAFSEMLIRTWRESIVYASTAGQY